MVRGEPLNNRAAGTDTEMSTTLTLLRVVRTNGGTESGLPESTPAGFCVFLSDPDPESHYHFGNSRSLCGHFLGKTWVNYGWVDDCSRGLNRSRILKFEE